MNNIYISTKLLLLATLLSIIGIYYFLFSYDKIIELFKDQYIVFGIISLLFCTYVFQNVKLKGYDILHFLPNLNHVPLKSTILIFIIFSIIDFYMEDGLKAMISLWLTYWCFGLLAYLLTININLYKNLRYYNYNEEKKKDK